MTTLALSGTLNVLAFIGLFLGLIVLLVVIWLLHGTLSPLRKILADLKDAKTAPMLERGVPGTDQLGVTRRLADSVPALALAYLQKLSMAPAPPAPAPAAAVPAAAAPAPAWTPPPAPAAPAAPAGTQVVSDLDDPRLPAWKRRP
jgi:hypothetical protein